MNDDRRLYVITAPPAPEKTSKAVALAKAIDAQIISADSRQIYRGMDLGTGKQQDITITGSSNMSQSDIERAIRDAETYAREDAQRKAEATARSRAEQLQYECATLLKKIDKQDRPAVLEAEKKLKKAMKSKDSAAILAACDEMEAVLRRYAPADDRNNGGAANSDGAFDADVSDGEPQ